MATVGLVMAALFAYDGFIGYPAKLQYAKAYESVASEVTSDVEQTKRWRELADSKGWPNDVPEKKASEIENDIQGQYWFGIGSLLIGLTALYFLLTWRRQWVEATDDGLVTSWGERVKFSDVSQLNKKKWDGKGIAKATYADGNKQRTFVFDDFKFEREPLGKILRNLEATLKPEQIVGGLSEAEKDKATAASSE